MDTALLLLVYLLPLFIALGRGLTGTSLALIAGGLALLPGVGWAAGLYFALADA